MNQNNTETPKGNGPAKKNYENQNSKLMTLNFSHANSVKKARAILPVLRERLRQKSIGLAVLAAAEYCLQEHIIRDFIKYSGSKR